MNDNLRKICPKCGKYTLTMVVNSEGCYYICRCGYDSRKWKKEEEKK